MTQNELIRVVLLKDPHARLIYITVRSIAYPQDYTPALEYARCRLTI